MDHALLHRLESLPPLQHPHGQPTQCKICHHPAPLFDVVDLLKHCAIGNQYQFGLAGIEVAYHRCRHCGFLFTTFLDQWTQQDCARFIYNEDYVLVDPDYTGARPTQLAAKIAKLLRGAEDMRILDYGSGSGIFAAQMRQAGFARIESYDPFSSPAKPAGLFDLVTCFEVLEHMPHPAQSVQDVLAWLTPAGCLIFSQSVQPPNIEDIRGAWWYLAPRNGHVSLFTVETLNRLLPSPAHALHGNGWLWAMVPPTPHPTLAPAMRAVGPVMAAHSLFAPATGAEDAWHAPETSPAGPFRWSKTTRLEWTLPPSPHATLLTLRIPFILEIEPNFAARCQIQIGNIPAQTTISTTAITAEAQIPPSATPITIQLQTPQPQSPFALRAAPDSRLLGLAIATA